VNLSPAGILVDAPAPCEVGSDILCDVTLPGGAKMLRGRVARLQPLSDVNVGVAIAFVDLSEDETAALRSLVERYRDPGTSLSVRFEGREQPIRARGVQTSDGFRFTTQLPFLRLGSMVEVDTGTPDAPALARGTVRSVLLDPGGPGGVPSLMIDVGGVADPAEAPAHTETPAQVTMATPPPQVSPITPPPVPEPVLEPVPEPERAIRRGLPWGRIAGVTIAMIAFATSLFVLLPRRSPPPAVPAPAPAPTPVQAVAPQPAPSEPQAAPTPASVAAPSPAPAAAATEPQAEPEPEAEPEPQPEPEPSSRPRASRPTVSITAGVATAVVPLQGSLEGARSYPLDEPPGMVVNLPAARATVPSGSYRQRRPGFRAIWVRPMSGGGTQLRFFFAGPHAGKPRVDLVRDSARVSVTLLGGATARR
jgi:hypothetical protein